MDKNFRIKGKVSLVDILLVCAGILGLFFLREFSAPEVAAQPGDARVRYTVELYRREEGFIDNVHIGDKLYDIERNFEIGTIVDKYDEPYLEDSPDFENGVFKRAPVAGLTNVYIVVEADARITDNATNIGQYQIMVGKEAFVQTKFFAAGSFIVAIERIE